MSLKGERDFLDTIHATAEHTFALLLSLIRNVPASACDVHDGKWNRDEFKGTELNGRTIGIIGYGRIGSKVAKYAEAFGMNVIANDILDIAGVNMTDLNSMESYVAPPVCGVIRRLECFRAYFQRASFFSQDFRPEFSPCNTSSAAPAICPDFRASSKAASSTISPRAVFIKRAPFFIC